MHNQAHLDILYKLKKEVEKSNHTSFIHTINQIIKKVYLEHYTMTFVGHFSAGKSTVINRLIGQDILPSSPVPTTSNTALLTISDEEGITANIEGQKYTNLNSYDEVKQMNRENYNVESIDIRFKSHQFQKGFTFQDTPGVDSNVQTHSASTESFLYTSNMVFYTVDYNHVQSALNFQFMKRLNHAHIPVVFIINQIDKHQDSEISFETFKKRVEDSIKEWNIQLEATFYITKFSHKENQFEALKAFIHKQDKERESINDYVDRMVHFITQHQSNYLDQKMNEILAQLNIEARVFDDAYASFLQNQAVHEESKLLSNTTALKTDLTKKRKHIIDNAYVMTHEMREHIRQYLESLAKDFKVSGWFNKSRKLEETQQTRLNLLMTALQSKVTQEIAKPMREDMAYLTRFIHDQELNALILNQKFEIPTELVSNLYQTQIQISNQYVLTFSENLMKHIRQYILKASETLDARIVNAIEITDETTETAENTSDARYFEQYIQLRDLKTSLNTKNYQHYYIHLDDSLDKLIDRTLITYEPKPFTNVDSVEKVHQGYNTNQVESNRDKIETALHLLQDIPLFQSTKNNINQTLKRIDRQLIKIGVFGTFSAGKSSLINALLGDSYLVSSPNPTTAATTEITYGSQNSITFKSPSTLLAEINDVSEVAGYSFQSIEDFLKSDTSKLKLKIDKNRLAFIHAIEQNYDLYLQLTKDSLSMAIPKEDIKKWSAEDQFATFVSTVQLQLPIEWLKDKIIVDSLGLHSNNQRHTNETEKILTTSDLIIYVSYFNHSFTDNDKAFIQHMKDMNQLMEHQAFKMVVNATDLAESDEDYHAVMTYVQNALNEVGMTPELFGVSSRNALKDGDKGINKLKSRIDQFAQVESKEVLTSQMKHQLDYMCDALKTMVHDEEDNHTKVAEQHAHLKLLRTPHVFDSHLLITTQQQAKNEISDQLYHLRERLNIQLLDEIKSVFNGQMTNTDDFKQEKAIASKRYLDQIHQKLYLEQTLIVERLKRCFANHFEHQLIPTLKALQERHVLLQPKLSFDLKQLETPYLKIDLEPFVQALPKLLSKKRLLQAQGQKEIHESIKMLTLQLLDTPLKDLQQALDDCLQVLINQGNALLKNLETEAQNEIDRVLSYRIDNNLIDTIKHILPTLENTLEIEDTHE
ncbi:dynamin family protein [Staphylococcus hyicus]|uniref:dynamin family protein n=1 Tax=Staphylococcus hyicus TaxID=1284 RepID=UPI0023651EE6|nr:dynamin family protein [Staphylococcus hyicus]